MKKNTNSSKNRFQGKTKNNIIKQKNFPFLLVGAFFLLIHACLNFAPGVERGWGLNFLSFFSWEVITLVYVVWIMVLILPVNAMIVKWIDNFRIDKLTSVAGKYRYILFILLSIIFGLIFYCLRNKYVFLGDLDIRAKQIEKGEMIYDEYLTMQMFKHLYIFLNTKFAWTGVQVIQCFSYISGGLFIFTSLIIANAIGRGFLQKLSFFILSTLSLATLMQFCGYLEIYALALLVLQIYICLCVLYLQRKVSLFFPFLALVLCVAVHSMLVCMLPSLIFLFYRGVLWEHPLFRKKATFWVLGIITVIVLYVGITKIAIRVMLPMSEGEEGFMTLFSIVHYKEFLNSQLLGGGIIFFVWLVTIFFYIVHKIKFAAFHWFYFIASLSMTGLLFVFNGIRGSGDWDIFSFGAVINNTMAAFFLLDLHNRKLVKNIKYGIVMLSAFAVSHTFLWIETNHTDKSIGWVKKAIEKDPASYYKGSFNNESLLGVIFSTNGLSEEAMYYKKKSYSRYRNDPRTSYNYAHELIKENRLDEATGVLEDGVNRFPAYALQYPTLANIYLENKNYSALYSVLTRMKAAYNQNPKDFTDRLSQEEINGYFDILRQLQEAMGK